MSSLGCEQEEISEQSLCALTWGFRKRKKIHFCGSGNKIIRTIIIVNIY